MTMIRRGAAAVALPTLTLLAATVLAGCADDGGDSGVFNFMFSSSLHYFLFIICQLS